MDIYVLILPLLIGWILDKLLGDPVGLPHPVGRIREADLFL